MILSSSEKKIVSSYGWADKGAFSIVDLIDRRISTCNIEKAAYVTIKSALNDHFVCHHHFEGARKLVLTIHSFKVPNVNKGRIEINNGKVNFDGEKKVWSLLPRFFVAYLREDSNAPYCLIEICTQRQEVVVHPMEWFNSTAYDLGYEAPTDAIEMPTGDCLLFVIGRRAPVLFDFSKKTYLREVFGVGTSQFQFIKQRTELWSIGYNDLVKSDAHSLKSIMTKKFQLPLKNGCEAGVGEYSFSPDERYCALARPHSNDILLLEPDTMNELARIKSKYQPLDVALFDNLDCVFRDWQTGNLDFQSFSL